MPLPDLDAWHMRRALELAAQGRGSVEPNPMVGCVVVQGAEIIGEGWHRRFGGDHAEVEALRLAGRRAAGATMYVTLEPCCHRGKTPPCTQAVIRSGVCRVVAAMRDPFPQVAGGGLAQLEAAGIEVQVGLLEADARQINAPYLKLLATGRPWIIAKWAMTLDGKTATRTGSSRWVSNEESRRIVHELRGRADAILIGRRTAEVDDPRLTARPPGPRTAVRIVVDSRASLSSESQLVRTAREVPVLVAVAPGAPAADRCRLEAAGSEVFSCQGDTPAARLDALLVELGRRRMTNILVEGGGQLAGSLLDAGQIDEVHVFISPKLVAGSAAPGPIGGYGIAQMPEALRLDGVEVRQVGTDVYVRGRVARPQAAS
jgi:diaminohydroxyphosphoribosylaminopyrimidine deaminase/5-amino-6-(5-phosphoribosylamino)uracil reductase